MYAQTITYGLLSARIANPHSKTADDFSAHMQTNPFLQGTDGDVPASRRTTREGWRKRD